MVLFLADFSGKFGLVWIGIVTGIVGSSDCGIMASSLAEDENIISKKVRQSTLVIALIIHESKIYSNFSSF